LHSHQLGHTLATQAINRGMRLEAIAALLGHRSMEMTLIYPCIANRAVADEYQAISAKIDALYGQAHQLPADYETTGKLTDPALAATPAAFAERVPPPGEGSGIAPPPPPVRVIAEGGMPGWQIILIALAAAVAVLLDRARAARKIHAPPPEPTTTPGRAACGPPPAAWPGPHNWAD
jgi:hypothetical protein